MRLLTAALLLAFPALLQGQASPYIPLDDPRLPAFELLVTRGEVRDPSPMVRPFRRSDALAVLLEADTGGAPGRRLVQELRGGWIQDTATARWTFEARGGIDAASTGTRDPLHPVGETGLLPYGELTGSLVVGPMIGVTRPAVEPRLTDDPDWPGRHDLKVVGRMAEAYLSGQWKYGNFFLGAMDRQWGPGMSPGIPVSAYAYPRTEFAFQVGTPKLNLTANSAQLTDDVDTLGARIHRYWFAHRVAFTPSRRLAVALWETTIIGGEDREFDGRWRNPLSVLLLSNQYGLGADGNIMLGADVSWWASRGVRLEGQVALDDLNYPDPDSDDQTPHRYAFTVAASGPLARTMAWKALYTQASSLVLRTFSSYETYADAGTGLGLGYPDRDQISLFLTLPVGGSSVLAPELTVQRQGEGDLDTPYPAADASAGNVPTLFIGTVETTWRAALGGSGAYRNFRAAWNAGVHYVQDADHIPGATRTEFQGRIRVTIGIATGGQLP
jgi:hypothetical protein